MNQKRGYFRRWFACTSFKRGRAAVASATARGYVLTPPSRPGANDIPGFRLNKNEVARFRFGTREDSYAAQLDKPQNIGVIGVVFYQEKEVYRPRRGAPDFSMTRGGASRGGVSRGGLGHDTGTEFGDRAEHRVETVAFERGVEAARFVFEYASAESLRAAGILVDPPLGSVDPFPADSGPGCTPPANWRGNR